MAETVETCWFRKYGTEVEESVALWKLLDYIDVYRTPLYNMMLHFIRNRVSSPPHHTTIEKIRYQLQLKIEKDF